MKNVLLGAPAVVVTLAITYDSPAQQQAFIEGHEIRVGADQVLATARDALAVTPAP